MSNTTTITKDVKKEETRPIPKGAIIISSNVKTDVEEIENGYLITKRTETRYKMKESEYGDWHYLTQKWYSKEDPLTIDVNDKSLSDAFTE